MPDVSQNRSSYASPIVSDTNARADAASRSALTKAKHNEAYLVNSKDTTHAPAKLRTRALPATLPQGLYLLAGSTVF